MTDDTSDLRDTIAPKSEQLNADDLLAGPIVVTVEAVRRGSREQPVNVHLTDRLPFRPCKSMRRVLVAAWGEDGRKWAGRSMRLYCDPDVKFGGVKVGGIRISHLSHIDSELMLPLTITRGKRAPFTVKPLESDAAPAMNGAAEGGDSIDAMTRPQIVDALKDGGLLGEAKAARAELGLDESDKSVEALRAIYRHILDQMP